MATTNLSCNTQLLQDTVIYTISILISIAFSRYGTDPLSHLIQGYTSYLLTTDTGRTVLALAIIYPLIQRREK
jgi:hypothetical protein